MMSRFKAWLKRTFGPATAADFTPRRPRYIEGSNQRELMIRRAEADEAEAGVYFPYVDATFKHGVCAVDGCGKPASDTYSIAVDEQLVCRDTPLCDQHCHDISRGGNVGVSMGAKVMPRPAQPDRTHHTLKVAEHCDEPGCSNQMDGYFVHEQHLLSRPIRSPLPAKPRCGAHVSGYQPYDPDAITRLNNAPIVTKAMLEQPWVQAERARIMAQHRALDTLEQGRVRCTDAGGNGGAGHVEIFHMENSPACNAYVEPPSYSTPSSHDGGSSASGSWGDSSNDSSSSSSDSGSSCGDSGGGDGGGGGD